MNHRPLAAAGGPAEGPVTVRAAIAPELRRRGLTAAYGDTPISQKPRARTALRDAPAYGAAWA